MLNLLRDKVLYILPPFPDMQKFPLRMKDNDLLVTELYRDPAGDPISAISVYLTPKTSMYYVVACREYPGISFAQKLQ